MVILAVAPLLPVTGEDEDAVVTSRTHHGDEQQDLGDEEDVHDEHQAVDQTHCDREGNTHSHRRHGRGDEGPEEQSDQDEDHQYGEDIDVTDVLHCACLHIIGDCRVAGKVGG